MYMYRPTYMCGKNWVQCKHSRSGVTWTTVADPPCLFSTYRLGWARNFARLVLKLALPPPPKKKPNPNKQEMGVWLNCPGSTTELAPCSEQGGWKWNLLASSQHNALTTDQGILPQSDESCTTFNSSSNLHTVKISVFAEVTTFNNQQLNWIKTKQTLSPVQEPQQVPWRHEWHCSYTEPNDTSSLLSKTWRFVPFKHYTPEKQ